MSELYCSGTNLLINIVDKAGLSPGLASGIIIIGIILREINYKITKFRLRECGNIA